METLVVVTQHRNQFYRKNSAPVSGRFGSFGSPPSGDFRNINCRTCEAGGGYTSTPLKSRSTHVNKHAFPSSPPLISNKTPYASSIIYSECERKHSNGLVSSDAIPIPLKDKASSNKGRPFSDEFLYSELWAGPAYSNSPPPSSLPIPKFSLRQKRTVSLELPPSDSDVDLHLISKSAPSSPTSEYNSSFRDLFSDDGADSATKTLRRILNLDISD